ncbi:MAG: glycoside hydrolase family 28 protein, partial [Trebonia sp.]
MTDCTQAIATAIAACNQAGGGHVVVPAGTFLTGAVHLRSNVDLHLEQGSTLRFSTDPAAYLPAVYSRWGGIELYNYSPFIYSCGQSNIGITGSGTLDGQASDTYWWPWVNESGPDWTALQQMADDGVPVSQRVFGAGHLLRPQFIQPYRCRDVLIEGVTITGSPMYHMNPVLCQNVTVRGVSALSQGPNNDGCDPESCSDVLISGCVFDDGDDCIAIKAGLGADGRRVNVPCENIVITDCDMQNKYGAIAIGSETTGGVRNVFASDCRMGGSSLHYALYIKTNALIGGFVENVFLRDIDISVINHEALSVNLYHSDTTGTGDYWDTDGAGGYPPLVRNIEVRNLTSQQSLAGYTLIGYPDDPIRDVRLIDCVFDGTATADSVHNVSGLVIT